MRWSNLKPNHLMVLVSRFRFFTWAIVMDITCACICRITRHIIKRCKYKADWRLRGKNAISEGNNRLFNLPINRKFNSSNCFNLNQKNKSKDRIIQKSNFKSETCLKNKCYQKYSTQSEIITATDRISHAYHPVALN